MIRTRLLIPVLLLALMGSLSAQTPQKKFMAAISPSATNPSQNRQPTAADVKKQVTQTEAAILKLLSAKEKARLKEIGVQYAGAFGLVDERMAKALGLSRSALYRRLQRYGL